MVETGALRVIGVQRLVANHPAPGDIVVDVEIIIDGCESLPGELASDAESSNVATHDEVHVGRQLMAQPDAQERIGPGHVGGR